MRGAAFTTALLTALLANGGCVSISWKEARTRPCVTAIDLAPDGREEFLRACASCHGLDGGGGGPVAAALRVPPADLTRLAERAGGRFPREQVIAALTGEIAVPAHGTREMPVWRERFGPSDFAATAAAAIYARQWLETLASHVESIQRPAIGSGSTTPSR